MKAIIVTGTPGSGKTTLSKNISRLRKYYYVDVSKIIKKNKMYSYFDFKRNCYVVDEMKLSRFLGSLIKNSKKKLVIDSHLSHYVLPKYVEFCIVTKCDLPELLYRLKKRGYSSKKIRENLDSEIFDVCLSDALNLGHKVCVIDTTKKIKDKVFNKILSQFHL